MVEDSLLLTKWQFLLVGILISLSGTAGAQQVTLKPTPKTVAWGYYDVRAAPVLRVNSGDTVEIRALITAIRSTKTHARVSLRMAV